MDGCCKEKKLYQSIFGNNVEVKLDLFHVVQRIVDSSLTKAVLQGLRFSKEFGLVFRACEDQYQSYANAIS